MFMFMFMFTVIFKSIEVAIIIFETLEHPDTLGWKKKSGNLGLKHPFWFPFFHFLDPLPGTIESV